MPVRDLTDRPHRITRLGKIRLGDRSGKNNAPVNRPYFVVPPEVAEVYGAEPTELRIVFLGEDEEAIASTYYRAYNATNGLYCKGDGRQADALLDADELRKRGGSISQPLPLDAWAHGATAGRGAATTTVIRQQIDCPGAGYDGKPPCPAFAAKKCAVRGFFQFAVIGVPGLGVYQMDTGSVINVDRVLGAVQLARSVFGRVAGVPMILRRVQAEVAPDGRKKKVWTVELVVDPAFSTVNILKLTQGPVAHALLPPVDESEPYEEVQDQDEEDEDETSAGSATAAQTRPARVATGPGFASQGAEPVTAPPAQRDRATAAQSDQRPPSGQANVTAFWAAIRKARPDGDWSTVVDGVLAESQKRYGNREPGHLTAGELQALREHLTQPKTPATPVEQAAHDHEPAYTGTGVLVCSICNQPLEQDEGQPVQPAMV